MDLKKLIMLLIMALCCVTPAKALDVSAHSAILLDGTTGQVLYEKNPDKRSLIASTTKIMTAIVTLEHAVLDDVVEIPQDAVGIEGSSMYLKAGERLTVEDLLHGLMLSSGNDAAVALALHVAGSVEDFAVLMNQKAGELGLSNTHFANPNGLDSDGNYGCARDLGTLAAYGLKNPDFLRIVSTKSYQCEGHYLNNHNKLLWQYDGAIGVKTGFTKKAGRLLVGGAQRNGRTLISVTVNAPNDWQDHKNMLDYGFSRYEETTIVSSGDILGEIPVISGTDASVPLAAAGELTYWALPGEQPESLLCVPEFLYAPVAPDTPVGTVEVYLGTHHLASLPVVTAEGAELLPEEKGFFEKLIEQLGVD